MNWLEFNRRLLRDAENDRTPLLERLNLIAIVSANTDEFFMQCVGALKQQLGGGTRKLKPGGLTPLLQVQEYHSQYRTLQREQYELLQRVLIQLKDHGIVISAVKVLKTVERRQLRDHFTENIYPLLTPQAIDPAHPFPFISNLSLNLLLTLNYSAGLDMQLARVKVPVGAGTSRFIPVPGRVNVFVRTEDLLMANLGMLIPGMRVVRCDLFRVTRSASAETDEAPENQIEMVESGLKGWRLNPVVRLEVVEGIPVFQRGRLAAELNINEHDDVFEGPELMALRDLAELVQPDFPHVKTA